MSVNLGPKIPIMVSGASGDTYLTQGNALLRALQPLLETNVIDLSLNTPPATPNNGDTYIVAAGGTGDWTGHDTEIAYWSTDNSTALGGEWEFYTPAKGWIIGNQLDGAAYIFDGATWVTIGTGGGGGVGTSASVVFLSDQQVAGITLATQTYNVTVAGTYRISRVVEVLTADATATITIVDTWDTGGVPDSITGVLGPAVAGPPGNIDVDNIVIHAAIGSTITFTVTVAGATGPFNYRATFVVEKLA
jgi:hypothetical protein